MTETVDDVVHRVLSTMFTNPDFHQSYNVPYMWYGTAEGKKWGVVVSSTDPPQYPNFILGKLSTERLVRAKSSDKIDEAHVVLAKREGASFRYLGHLTVESLYQQLENVRSIMGRSGLEFWILPSSITGEYDDDPF
jgi:hypothetical protein